MLDYIQTLVKKPKEIYIARNMKNRHFFLFILLISFILTFLSSFQIKEDYNQLIVDYGEIQDSVPTYELNDGYLESNEDSYIYQTDSLIFYFDPENIVGTELIDKNMRNQPAPISVALMKESIYLNVLGQSRSLKYTDFNLTSQDLKAIVNLDRLTSPIYFLLMLFILYLFQLFLYSIQLLSISIFANLISFILKSKLKFFQNAKIALLASFIPFTLMGILNAVGLSISYQYELTTLLSLLLFYLSINEFKHRLADQKKSNNTK